MIPTQDRFIKLKKIISEEKKILGEVSALYSEEIEDPIEKKMIKEQEDKLLELFRRNNSEIKKIIEGLILSKSLNGPRKIKIPKLSEIRGIKTAVGGVQTKKVQEKLKYEKDIIKEIEKETLKRFKKKEQKKEIKKERKASSYVSLANRIFGKISSSSLEKGGFKGLKLDLLKANMPYIAKAYLSVIFFNTFLVGVISVFVFLFFLFFNLSPLYPFLILVEEGILTRFVNIFWILIVFPLIVFMLSYFYPSMEKKSIESRINHELPFATIHMAAISESLVEPSNIFRIIISTKEYPNLEREFIKLMNEINIFGCDLVTALRNTAFNSPSKKLSELLDGIATTITSGGDLSDFFDKRAQTLLFEYKLDQEKNTKTAETFMDIYISVVIATPMILMLLLIMMRVSGLGISLSTSMISLIMVLGVSAINAVFLVFLQMRSKG